MRIESIAPMRTCSVEGQKFLKDGLERSFLAEMLKVAGPKPMGGSFGGGIGEEQFSSMMTDITAEALSKRLDLGLKLTTGEDICLTSKN